MVDLHITIQVLNCLVNKLLKILILLLSPIFIDIKVILLCFLTSLTLNNEKYSLYAFNLFKGTDNLFLVELKKNKQKK